MMRIIFLEESSYSFTVFRCLIFGGKVKSLHSFKTCKTSIKTFSRLSVTLIIFIVIYYIFKKFVLNAEMVNKVIHCDVMIQRIE